LWAMMIMGKMPFTFWLTVMDMMNLMNPPKQSNVTTTFLKFTSPNLGVTMIYLSSLRCLSKKDSAKHAD